MVNSHFIFLFCYTCTLAFKLHTLLMCLHVLSYKQIISNFFLSNLLLFFTVDTPKITLHPESKSVVTGQPTTFTVEATGDDLQFKWQKNGVDLSEDGRHHGTDTDTLHIVNVEKDDNKSHYRCLVKNDIEESFSQQAVLTISK